ncbi:MAG TPA: ABC transporter ATP-binding protein [Chloroflexota bacterium]|nr:ABC transporter ATP-binding protein [Chloroflexota bacterium]
MIEVRNLTKRFGDTTAVDGLTLEVDEGEVFGLLGPNGAGKTTTLRMLCCLIAKTSGEARIGGREVGNEADSIHIRRMIGLVSDNLGLYDDLTAYQNLIFHAKLYGCEEPAAKRNIQRFLTMLGLWERRDADAGTYSKGMKQKLAVARALVHDPKVLFLDEPTANLDPESSKTVRDFLLELKTEKRTIVLNTHNLPEAQSICDRIGILNTKLVAIGTPAELERSAGRSRVVVRLERLDEAGAALTAAVRSVLPTAQVAAEGDQLMIDVEEPEKRTPDIVEAVVRAGGRIRSAGVVGSSLEEAYLQLVRRQD